MSSAGIPVTTQPARRTRTTAPVTVAPTAKRRYQEVEFNLAGLSSLSRSEILDDLNAIKIAIDEETRRRQEAASSGKGEAGRRKTRADNRPAHSKDQPAASRKSQKEENEILMRSQEEELHEVRSRVNELKKQLTAQETEIKSLRAAGVSGSNRFLLRRRAHAAPTGPRCFAPPRTFTVHG